METYTENEIISEHALGNEKLKRLKEFYNNYKENSNGYSERAPIEVELAYEILSEAGKDNPIYFKKLIREIIFIMEKKVQNEAAAISEIYTMINMDSRFQHVKDGQWGLSDWYPPETKRSRSTSKTVKIG